MSHGSGRRSAGVVLAVLLTTACTTGTATDGGLTSSPPARVTDSGTAVPVGGAGGGAGVRPLPSASMRGDLVAPTQPPLAPGMTPIAEASLCSVTRLLAATAPVQPAAIWPDSPHRGLSGTETVRRAHPSCVRPSSLPTSCETGFPHVAASDDAILLGLGADRLTRGEAHAEVSAPSGAIPSQEAVLYTVLHFGPSGPAALAFEAARKRLTTVVTRCVRGRPGHLGVDGVVGERETVMAVPSFQYANFVFGPAGRNLIWLVVDGVGWTDATREQAARTAVAAISREPAP